MLLVICRPYLEARRPYASLALAAGIALGSFDSPLVAKVVLPGLQPLMGLAAGWLALLAANSWDMGHLAWTRGARMLALAGMAGLAASGLGMLAPAILGGAFDGAGWPILVGPLAILACAAVALDPEAAREALHGSSRPGPAMREAPAAAALVLSGSLAGICLAWALQAGTAGGSSWAGARHLLLTLAAGAGLGIVFAGLLRLAEGRGPLLIFLISLPLLGSGLAHKWGLSPLAVIFIAGVVLTGERTRRDLISVLLRELERPFTVALLVLAGAAVPLGQGTLRLGAFWILAGGFTLARPGAWRFMRPGGLRPLDALPLSPLAIPLALEALSWQGSGVTGLLPAAVTLAFILSETAWIVSTARSARG